MTTAGDQITAKWPDHIQSETQAEAWMVSLFKEGINFHPDTPGRDYGWVDRGPVFTKFTALFSEEQADRFDTLIGECFEVCEDVYATCIRAFESLTEWESFLDLPSEETLLPRVNNQAITW